MVILNCTESHSNKTYNGNDGESSDIGIPEQEGDINMVGNNFKMRKLYFCIHILLVCCIALCFQSCKASNLKSMEIPFKSIKTLYTKWDQVFEKSTIIPFHFDDPDMEIYTIGNVSINSKGDYLISDGKNPNKILLFDRNGKFKKYIGYVGEGPGGYMLPASIFLDKEDNIYIQDLGKAIIQKYSYPNYNYEKLIRMDGKNKKVFIDASLNLYSYIVQSETGNLFFKYNFDGKLLRSAIKPKNISQKLFIGRFNLGGLINIPWEGILAIYPAEYKIYFLDYDLNIKKILVADPPTTYKPLMEDFPNDLSPYDFSKRHLKWWGKQLRPTNIYYLENHFFLMLLTKYENLSGKYYVNIHDIDGNTYAEGLEVPFNGIIRYTKDGYIYLVEDSAYNDKGEIEPLRLHRFKFKIKSNQYGGNK